MNVANNQKLWFDHLSVNNTDLSSTNLDGTVVDGDGNAVEDATVEVYGVDFDDLDDSISDKKAEAQDLLDQAKNPEPPEFDANFDLSKNGVTDKFQTHGTYVLAHTADDWHVDATPRAAQLATPLLPTTHPTPDLENPAVEFDSNRVVLSLWNDDEPFGGEDPIDLQLFGQTTSGTIVVEQLDNTGDVVNRRELKTSDFYTFLVRSKVHENLILSLPDGFYRIHPKDNEAAGYVIKVGDPAKAIEKSLRSDANALLSQAQSIQNKLDDGRFQRLTTTTDANGDWSINVGSTVNVVDIQAYKADGSVIDPNSADGVQTQLRDHIETRIRKLENGQIDVQDINPVYVPADGPKRVEPPKSNVTVEVRKEFSVAGQAPDLFAEHQDAITRGLAGLSLSDLSYPTQQAEDTLNDSRDRAENITDDFQEVVNENDQLRERVDDLQQQVDRLKNATEGQGDNITINVDTVSNKTLQAQLDALQQAITELKGEVDVTEGDTSTTQDTISQELIIDAPVDKDSIAVFADYSNGTTVPVTDKYLSIDQSLGTAVGAGETAVRIEDYPLNDSDPAAVSFRVVAATRDEFGTGATNPISNPALAADPPNLNFVDVTTLNPDSDETVTVRVGSDDADFNRVENVTVRGPGGAINATRVTDNKFRFTTNGAGAHAVEIKYSDLDGNEYTIRPRLNATEAGLPFPASIRAVSSPAGGQYALVGDGLAGGDVSTPASQSRVVIKGEIKPDEDVPSELKVYANSLSLPPESEVDVQLTRTDGQTISQRVGLTLHLPALPEGAHIRREADDGDLDPLPKEGARGSWTTSGEQTRIQTVTTDDGSVAVKQNADPSLLDEVQFTVDRTIQQIPTPSLPGLSLWLALPLPAIGLLGRRSALGGDRP